MPEPTPCPPRSASDWLRIRGDFPALDQRFEGGPLIYFDNAATSQKPRPVISAMVRFYENDNANVHRGLHTLSMRATEAFEGARESVARFINAQTSEEIVFTRGTTEAINLVAQSWGAAHLREGDVVLLTELEHHSNLVPWQLLARSTGARLRFLPIRTDGSLAIERLDEFLTPDVRLFAVTHVSNALGTINPVNELCAAARRAGAVSLVDGAQGAGHLPVDVQAIGCDFYAFSAHKMCGPTGIGALYGRMELLEAMPPWQGGGEMIVRVEPESATYKPPPHRFEAGTPAFAQAVGFGAAITYLEGVGVDAIAQRDMELTGHADEVFRSIDGLRVFSPPGPRGPVCSFTIDGIHPHDLVTYADEAGLALRGGHHCAQPLMRRLGVAGTVRASFYFYNTMDEIDAMAEVLRSARKFFH